VFGMNKWECICFSVLGSLIIIGVAVYNIALVVCGK
jgi:hypothetical protein